MGKLHSASSIPAAQCASLAAGAVCALALLLQPASALASVAAAPPPPQQEQGARASSAITPVYFGNGCFWGRQYDFAQTELKALGRPGQQVSAVVGYAGGRQQPADGKVCYYYGPEGSVYEKLGHAEVVQVELSTEQAEAQFREFATTYFQTQFTKTPFGMMRQDPQDTGAGYRNVVGLPGGVRSPLFRVLQEANVQGMQLLEGSGNEGDKFNTVWVVDSNALPFNRAEDYHQFHNGLGKAFPASYTRDLRRESASAGRIGSTGCPEVFFQ